MQKKTARDIMTPNPVTISPDTKISEAAQILLDKRFNGLPVVEDNTLVGIICQTDLVMQQRKFKVPTVFYMLDGFITVPSVPMIEDEIKRMHAVVVRDAMSTFLVTVTPDTSITEVATLMIKDKYHTLPVVENNKLVGIIGKEDLLRLLVTQQG